MTCSKCGGDNPGDALFCEKCGAKLERACPSCGAAVSPDARFCKRCGQKLGSQPPLAAVPKATTHAGVRIVQDPSASGVIEGERKTVTALFADIKGSMELMEDLDPEEARANKGRESSSAGRRQHGRGGDPFDPDRRRMGNTRRLAIPPAWRRGCRHWRTWCAVVIGESLQRLTEGYSELGPARIKCVCEAKAGRR
jgi:ribosomal protein L40E